MAKQWSKEEKIKAIKYSNKYEINKTIKKFNINYTTIIRWRSEFKKHGEYSLKWGNGKQATTHKHKPRIEKNVDINLMSREEIIEYINLSEDIKKFVVLSKKKKFRIICDLRRKYNVKWMYKILEISYSGFYNWIKLGYSKFNKWDKTLAWIIKLTYLFYNQKYGYRLLTKLINKMGNLNLAEHIFYRYMKNLGIKSVINKKTKFKYPESTENSKTANLLLKTNKYGKLKRNFYTTDINQVWVTDITYLLTSNKLFYLTIIRDIHNGEIIDWNISSNFSNGFVFQSLKNAWVKRNKLKNVIIRSDHGIQYIKQEWNILTGQLDMWMSMSRKDNPADNGCCETWFKSYKYECLNLIPKSNRTKEVLMKVIHNYVNFYNNYRPLTKLKRMSPVEYRLHS